MKRIVSLLIVFVVLIIALAACGMINLSTTTQSLGDQDVALGQYNASIAGQFANWQGHGASVWVYMVTGDPCTATTAYVKPPQTAFSLSVACKDGTRWAINGKTSPDGRITSAIARKL